MSIKQFISVLGAGVVVGILIAPRKGSESRERLSEVIDDVAGNIQGFIETAREKVNNLADRGNDKVEDIKTDINEALLS